MLFHNLVKGLQYMSSYLQWSAVFLWVTYCLIPFCFMLIGLTIYMEKLNLYYVSYGNPTLNHLQYRNNYYFLLPPQHMYWKQFVHIHSSVYLQNHHLLFYLICMLFNRHVRNKPSTYSDHYDSMTFFTTFSLCSSSPYLLVLSGKF